MNKIVLLTLAVLLSCFSHAMAEVVEAAGEGPSKEQALVSAMRSAVEQGVGAYLTSSTTVVDSALVEDKILSHSKGYVSSYKIIREGRTENGFSVTISAKVDNKTIKGDIDALTILRNNVGNPRILVALSKKNEGAQIFKSADFLDEIYNSIVETLTDKQFRVVDKASAERFAQQVATTHEINTNLNKAAAYGLKFNAEYSLLYSVSGTVRDGTVGKGVLLRIKSQLIDNTRSQVITSKLVEQAGNGQTIESALEKAARDGGKKIVNPMVEIIQKNWMDMQQNGALYTVVIDGMDDSEDIARFTGMLEKFPLVNSAKEVESGGGKTTFEATYKGKRDQLDRDVIRTSRELGWTLKKIRAEGARSSWKRQ
ncbi:MAG: hypothetical protein HY888_10200 [Deltaproteobacteria bacterium]|nr:hypothetical protein [Deltaproteobacteria bacterium]